VSSTLSYLCPARSWSNASEFNEWLYDQAKNEQKRDCPKKPLNDQNLGFDTYILAHPKHASLSRCLCGFEGRPSDNVIQLKDDYSEVPLHWAEGDLNATQIVQGKRKRKVMRSYKLVLCQVEDPRSKWFEVTVLNDDLSYPFDACMLGLKCWAFTDYAKAKKQFNKLISKARKEVA
jgi:hypothetical protein